MCLVGLRLPERERYRERGDQDRGADDVPLAPPQYPDIVRQPTLLRARGWGFEPDRRFLESMVIF
jgi:hypothetical protein